jgi:DNA-binding beta-propeller fold protein YncE
VSAQTSPPIGLLAIAGLGLAILSIPACDRPASGPHHPVDHLDYPVAVTADPSKAFVWVTSGNFDLAWRGGAILAIDVIDHSFVKAKTEDGLVVPVGAEIGSFPGPMELLVRDGVAVAGYVLSRTESALYLVQLSGNPRAPVVDCPGGVRAESGLMICPAESAIDEQPITNAAQEADTLDLGIDPYGAMVHDIGEDDRSLLLTGGMVDGNVALFELDAVGTPTGLAELDITGGLLDFVANPLTGRIYASHKHSNAISVLALAPPNASDAAGTLRLEKLGTIPLPANILSIDHGRGMAISPDGKRLYAAYRAPSSVLVIDVSDQASAEPSERVLAKIPVHSRPSDVVVAPEGHGLPELVYVSCYLGDRIDVIDPALGLTIDTIAVGDGPSGMAFLENEALGIRRLYVANFHGQSVGVIELDPGSAAYHTQIAEVR